MGMITTQYSHAQFAHPSICVSFVVVRVHTANTTLLESDLGADTKSNTKYGSLSH